MGIIHSFKDFLQPDRKSAGSTVITAWLAVVLFMGGCATTQQPLPTDALAQAKSAIRQALEVGADQYAPDPLNSAQQALGTARTLVEEREAQRARYAAETAIAYAELALAVTEAERADQKADRAENELARVRAEIARTRE